MKTLFLLLLLPLGLFAAVIQSSQDSAVGWNERGSGLFATNHFREAQSCFEKALALAESAGNRDPVQIATISINLASAYRIEARYPEAEHLFRKAMDSVSGVPGENTIRANALRGLTLLYLAQGRIVEAEDCAREDLRLRQERGDTLAVPQATDDLANILLTRGKYEEAKELATQALSVAVTRGDRESQIAAANAHNILGRIHLAQGENREAVEDFSQAAGGFERLFTRDSPSLAAAWDNLAKAQMRCGDSSSAIKLMARSIATLEKVYGPDHPEVASGLANLGLAYQDRRQYGKARSLFERALKIDTAALGANAAKTAVDLNNLGGLAYAQHRLSESEQFLNRALAIDEQQLGHDHPDTVLIAGDLGEVYLEEKRYADAEPLLKRASGARGAYYRSRLEQQVVHWDPRAQ